MRLDPRDDDRLIERLKGDYDALKARVAELEKDAARYRWLKSDAQRLDDATQILPECFDSYIDSMMASPGADGGQHG